MKEINYNDYPCLLLTSYDKDDLPPEIPFGVVAESARDYLSKEKGYLDLFALIAVKNTYAKTNISTYFWIEDDLCRQIDGDDHFRSVQFSKFFSECMESKQGVILFKDGMQYVYVLLDAEETEKLKKRKGQYIAVGLFKEDYFLGFEEGYIFEGGIGIKAGYYEFDSMPAGGFVSFVLITLAYAVDSKKPALETSVKEKIIKLQ